MPRKKQGLRSYHHKSRNGCLQCKRRRVKCSMQAPACANCVRRDETCEYAGVSYKPNNRDIFGSFDRLPIVNSDNVAQSMTWGMPHSQYGFPDTAFSNTSSIGTMLQAVMGRSWFAPIEAGVWSKAILDNIHKHPYLQHCVYSVAYLRRDLLDNPSNSCTSAVAYEHQMAASALFRQRTTPVQHDNWIPTLVFHVFMLVFEFASQAACADSQFNLVDTLRVLRSSHAIEEEAKPYFRASKFWLLVSNRDRATKYEVDPALHTNLLALGGVIAELASSRAYNAALNLQALAELKQWVVLCDAHPRRWDHYCHWPGHLSPLFLQLLADGDDVASILIIHWAALLYRSPKPTVYKWAKRTARSAIGQLKERDKWVNLLAWPLRILYGGKDLELSKINMSEQSKMLEVDKQLRAFNTSGIGSYGADNLFGNITTLEVPPPLTTTTTTPSSSIGSPAQIFSEDASSLYDSTWTTGSRNTPCVVPQMDSLTETDMLVDPIFLQLDKPDDECSAGWQVQCTAPSMPIELTQFLERSVFS